MNFSKDGNRLLTASDDKIIKLWTINYRKGADQIRKAVDHSFVKSFVGHTDWVLEAKFSPDSRLVASVCTKSVRLWDVNTGQEVTKFKHVSLQNTSVSFHPDGNYLAVGSAGKHVKIWDMRAQRLVQDYQMSAPVNSVDFHFAGTVLASANNFIPGVASSSLNLFDIRQNRCVFEIEGIHDSLNSVRFSGDGEYMAAGGSNKLVYVWKTNLSGHKPEMEEQATPREEELSRKVKNEIDMGTAISLEKHLAAYEDRAKNDVYEQISTNLENIVMKINTISEYYQTNQKSVGTRLSASGI